MGALLSTGRQPRAAGAGRGLTSQSAARALALVLLSALACAPAEPRSPEAKAPAPAPPPRAQARLRLAAGSRLSRHPAPQTTDPFELALRAGDLLEVTAEQHGADVALSLHGAGGALLLRIDSPTGRQGPERLLFVAPEGGVFPLDVEVGGVDPGGSYELSVVALRPAGAREREEARTLALFAQAEELRRAKGSPESWKRALPLYRQAIERFLAAKGDSPSARSGQSDQAARSGLAAQALLQLARTEAQLRDHGAAARAIEEALPLLQARRDAAGEAAAWADLGRERAAAGEAQAGLAANARARRLARAQRNERLEARVLDQIATLFRDAGRLAEAEWAYEEAASLYRRQEVPRYAGIAYANLASLYVEVGDGELAGSALARAEEAFAGHASPEDDAYLALERGEVARLAGHDAAAAERFTEARALAGSLPRPELLASARRGLTRLALKRKDLAEAERLARETLASAEAEGRGEDVALARQDLGQILLRRRELAPARELFERALAGPAGEENRATRAAALLGLARVAREEGRLELASTFAGDALELVEGRRTDASRRELRLALFADVQDFFDLAVEIEVALDRRAPRTGHLERAFAIAERGRARSLLDALTEPGGAGGAGGGALGRRARLEDARRERERQRDALIESGGSAGELRAVERELASLVAEEEALPEPDLASLPAPAAEPPAGKRFEDGLLDLLERHLDADTLLLEVDLGQDRSFLFLLGRGVREVFELPGRDELETAAREAHDLLAQSASIMAGDRPRQAMRRLGERLLGPVADRLDRHRLLILPDGALWAVPFGALRLPGAPGPAGVAGGERALIEDHDLTYAPSAASLLALAARGGSRMPAAPRAVVLADPVFEADDRRVHRGGEPAPPPPPIEDPAGPSYHPSRLAPSGGDVVGPSDGVRAAGERLHRLGSSAGEARVLGELLPPGDRVVLEGFAASRRSLAALPLGSFDLLHFATHGILNSQEPSLSGLVLSLVDEQGRPVDGFLRAHEIEQLHLRAALVVASACHTAEGKEIRGEGVLSLARAFFRAGAARVLVTLWPVDDRATSELMRRFYRALLLERRSPAAALRQAQEELRALPPWGAPYYWAGFVLQGDF